MDAGLETSVIVARSRGVPSDAGRVPMGRSDGGQYIQGRKVTAEQEGIDLSETDGTTDPILLEMLEEASYNQASL